MSTQRRKRSSKRRRRRNFRFLGIVSILSISLIAVLIMLISDGKDKDTDTTDDPNTNVEESVEDKNNSNSNNNNSSKKQKTNNPKQFTIWIDAGHGYTDGGATSKLTDLKEKDIDLSYALQLRDKLEDMGFTVLMTRENDVVPAWLQKNKNGNYIFSASMRPDYINKSDADISVSLHCNSSDWPTASATWIVYDMNKSKQNENHQNDAFWESLTEYRSCMMDALTAAFPGRKITYSDGSDNYLCRHINVPAILLECGFMTTDSDCELIIDSKWQDTYTTAVADAIQSYWKWYIEN